jgi:hypothetical protein
MNIGNKVGFFDPSHWLTGGMGAPSATISQRRTALCPQETSILGHVAATEREMPANGDGCVALGACWRGWEALAQLGRILFRHTSLALNRINANSPKGLLLCRTAVSSLMRALSRNASTAPPSYPPGRHHQRPPPEKLRKCCGVFDRVHVTMWQLQIRQMLEGMWV